MVVELFTSEQFEDALERSGPYEKLGVVNGEFSYRVSLDGQSALMIRSSVKANDLSAGSSKDSIRAWLVDNEGKPLARNRFKWISRQPGWQDRLNERMIEITKTRELIGDCQKCGKPKGLYRVKQGQNKGKWFVKCFDCNVGFVWFDELKLENVWFSEVSHGKVSNSECGVPERKRRDISFDNSQGKTANRLSAIGMSTRETNKANEDGNDKISPSQPDMPQVPGSNDSSGLAAFLAKAESIEPDEPRVVLPPVIWSHYQNDVYDFVRDGKGHGMVHGVAGCGKTRTNVHSLSLLDPKLKIKFSAFNNHIYKDMRAKTPSHINVSTFHVWGKDSINAEAKRKGQSKPLIKEYKVWDIVDSLNLANSNRDLKIVIAKLVGLLKGTLLEPTDKNIQQLADDFCLDIEPDDAGKVRRAFNASIANMKIIDFDDMVYFPAAGLVPCQKFDFIAIDEYQDLDWAQSTMAINSLAENGRILGIGDPNQSMYQFRGAGIGIMDRVTKILDATQLPLSISYRAPLAIVDLVNRKYPHIDFEAAPGAIAGSIDYIDYKDFYEIVNENHGVICRTNAPLVAPCFALIRRGIKATILGRDIGKGLLGLIKKREKLARVKDLDGLLSDLKIFQKNETRKFERDNKLSRAALLDDQVKTVNALAAECQTIDDLKHKADTVFSGSQQGVTFSTIHKAKGLEWNTVHILEPQLMPHPMARNKRDRAQETNIMYVADTRTKNKLYYVGE